MYTSVKSSSALLPALAWTGNSKCVHDSEAITLTLGVKKDCEMHKRCTRVASLVPDWSLCSDALTNNNIPTSCANYNN